MAAVSAYDTSSLHEKEKDLPEQVENVLEHGQRKDVGISEAIHAEEQEHIGIMAAFKLHPKATFWSFCVSFVIVSHLTFDLRGRPPGHTSSCIL